MDHSHDNDPRVSSAASAAIRDATPAPDDAALHRIATLIQSGGRRATHAATPPPSRHVRRLRTPAVAAGIALVAAGVTLLAPVGGDQGSSTLGPEVASAALRRAGDQSFDRARAAGPLDRGEYIYLASTESDPDRRITTTQDRWIGGDGFTRTDTYERQLGVPTGARYWVPARSCDGGANPTGVPTTISEPEILPAASTAPRCWKNGNMGVLEFASGPIVDEPPANAQVEMRDQHMMWNSLPRGDYRYGASLLEGTVDRSGPPGHEHTRQVEQGGLITQERLEATVDNPFVVARSMTWVEVSSKPRLVSSVTRGPEAAEVDLPFESDWRRLVPFAEIAGLPRSGSSMRALLETRAAARNADQRRRAEAGEMSSPYPSDDFATIALAIQLLQEAPLQPGARRAIFDALASLGADVDARIERDEALPDGRTGLRVTFPLMPNDPYESTYAIVLDEQTGDLRATETRLAADRVYVTRWDRPIRTGSLRVPKS